MYKSISSREDYVRSMRGYTMIVRKPELDAVVYVCTTKKIAMAFHGKAQKPAFFERFRNQKDMELRIKEYFENLINARNYKAERKAQQNAPHGLEGGEIFATSWGYEQTNVEFYQVVKVLGPTMVEVQELAQDRVHTGNMSGHCSAIAGQYLNKAPLKRRVVDGAIKIHNSARAYRWDGRPKHFSTYG